MTISLQVLMVCARYLAHVPRRLNLSRYELYLQNLDRIPFFHASLYFILAGLP